MRPPRPNLTLAAGVCALGELVLHRVLGRHFLPGHGAAAGATVLDFAGRLSLYLGASLALALLVGGAIGAFRRRELFPRPARFAMGAIGIFFALLAALGLVVGSPSERLLAHLKTSQAFLAWFMVTSLWRTPGAVRSKLGVTLFALVPMLHAAAVFAQRGGDAGTVPGGLLRAADLGALLAGAFSPFLLGGGTAGRARWLLGIGAGILALAAFLGGTLASFDLVQTVALYGFQLDLPAPTSAAPIAYLGLVGTAVVGLAVAIARSLAQRGPMRLCGLGLVLVVAAGQQSSAPHLALFAAAGLFAMTMAAARQGALRLGIAPATTASP